MTATTEATATSPINEFKNWLRTFAKDELTDFEGAQVYAQQLYDEADETAIVYLLSQYLVSVANVISREKTSAEKQRIELTERFESLTADFAVDFENLVFLKAVLNLLEAMPGKTLREIADRS